MLCDSTTQSYLGTERVTDHNQFGLYSAEGEFSRLFREASRVKCLIVVVVRWG